VDISAYILWVSEIEYNFIVAWFEAWGLIGKLIGGMVLGIGVVFIILWLVGTLLRHSQEIGYD
jgi:hypothetical protein